MQKLPPKYRYPLYHKWDKDCYKIIAKLARKKSVPKILGTKEEINQFLKILIRSQKMDDWRKLLKLILKEVSSEKIDITKILKHKFKIPKGYEKRSLFAAGREVLDFIDKLEKRKIQFIGTEREIYEFILRFLLTQLLFDWKSSLLAIKITVGKKLKVKVKSLNKVLSEFDYTNVF